MVVAAMAVAVMAGATGVGLAVEMAEVRAVEKEGVAMAVAMVVATEAAKAVEMEGAATAAAKVGEKVVVEKAVEKEVEATVGTWAAGRSQYNRTHSRTAPELQTVL